MGRSKLYNNKEAKQLVAAQESLDQAPRGDLNRGGKGGVLGVKQRGKFVRDTRRRAKTENNWLHGVLFVLQCRCHILVIDYRWGSMGSNETAITIPGGPRVIDVFDGNGAPSGPNYLLFSGADRLLEASRGRSGSG